MNPTSTVDLQFNPERDELKSPDGGKARSLLVVYDSASKSRQLGGSTVVVDVFRLSRTSAPRRAYPKASKRGVTSGSALTARKRAAR
jgi:hypothetical protein